MKKVFIYLFATLLCLTACGQKTEPTVNHSDQQKTDKSVVKKSESITKSYQTDQVFEGGKETRVLTLTYKGSEYEKVILRINRTIPANIKETMGEDGISSAKNELLETAESLLGLDKIETINGIDMRADATSDEFLFVISVNPKELDFEAVKQIPTYGELFGQIQTLSPEEFLNNFKGESGVEVPNLSE